MGRRERRAQRAEAVQQAQPKGQKKPAAKPPQTPKSKGGQQSRQGKRQLSGTVKRKRPPRTAAVTITCADGGYQETLAKARKEVDLRKLGFDSLRIREAATGAMVVELPGCGEKEDPTAAQRADALYSELHRIFAGNEGVARLIRKAELRLRGLDRSLAAADNVAIIAGEGSASRGTSGSGTSNSRLGMGTIWAQCPLRA
ncbi:uncharacterized protein LOC115232853 [Formica exsecta]|uniref:uncharacterized protein LOC115232853 n=1 Tax=Formica exsecta TaxID=72781 RepID=UPI001143F096|nr:uncharacterized protein LOC115232853 [Formica exsecta]